MLEFRKDAALTQFHKSFILYEFLKGTKHKTFDRIGQCQVLSITFREI